MKAPSPAFSFYPKDYLSDERVRGMSHEARGIYVDLLCHCWLEGSVPSDVDELARLVRVPRPHFAKLWRDIRPCFKARGRRLVQTRLELERRKQRAYRKQQREKGLKGGRPKSHGLHSAKPNESLPSSTPSPSATPQKSESTRQLFFKGERLRVTKGQHEVLQRMANGVDVDFPPFYAELDFELIESGEPFDVLDYCTSRLKAKLGIRRPPTPTEQDYREAAAARRRLLGCPHDPTCDDYESCVALMAARVMERRH